MTEGVGVGVVRQRRSLGRPLDETIGTLQRTVYTDTEDWAALLEAGRDMPTDALSERQDDLAPDDPMCERTAEALAADGWMHTGDLAVMREGGEPLDAQKLREFATGRLAHYEIPRYVLVVEESPMAVTGKVRKVEMRERSVFELGL